MLCQISNRQTETKQTLYNLYPHEMANGGGVEEDYAYFSFNSQAQHFPPYGWNLLGSRTYSTHFAIWGTKLLPVVVIIVAGARLVCFKLVFLRVQMKFTFFSSAHFLSLSFARFRLCFCRSSMLQLEPQHDIRSLVIVCVLVRILTTE